MGVLTREDLAAIGQLIDERIDMRFTLFEERIEKRFVSIESRLSNLEKDIGIMKRDVRKLKKDMNVMLTAMDWADVELGKRVRRVEDHLGFSN